jgi:hypothetical protein
MIIMFTFLLQVNFGVSPASIVGLLYIALGLAYFFFFLTWLLSRFRRLSTASAILYLLQVVFIPVILFCCGMILIFQGWRLDPTLQFTIFLLSLIILYLSIKDILINAIYRNR